jgi:hypothetical protein
MSECIGAGCTHPECLQHAAEALTPPQYGTSVHYPSCRWSQCTGCYLPPPPSQADPDGRAIAAQLGQAQQRDHEEARRELGTSLGWNPDKFAALPRRERRAAARKARRR